MGLGKGSGNLPCRDFPSPPQYLVLFFLPSSHRLVEFSDSMEPMMCANPITKPKENLLLQLVIQIPSFQPGYSQALDILRQEYFQGTVWVNNCFGADWKQKDIRLATQPAWCCCAFTGLSNDARIQPRFTTNRAFILVFGRTAERECKRPNFQQEVSCRTAILKFRNSRLTRQNVPRCEVWKLHGFLRCGS